MKAPTLVICLSPINGGMELSALKLAKLFSGECPTHFMVKEGGFLDRHSAQLLGGYDVRVHRVGFKRFFSLALIRSTRRILRENGIENVLFLGASEMRSLYFAALGMDLNFIIRQGSRKKSPKKDPFHRLIYSKVSAFVGNSEFMRRNIAEILPIPPGARLERIYASMLFPETIVQKPLDGILDIVHVGRLQPGKGQMDTLQACARLHEANIPFRLRFLGDFENQAFYEKLKANVERSPYRSSVEFVGHTSDVSRYLQTSDLFVLPSQGEGMSNAIIEALAHGVVTLIYNHTSSPEFVDLGFSLHLTSENTVEELGNSLLAIARNLKEEKAAALGNIAHARDVFSPEREKQEYLALLR